MSHAQRNSALEPADASRLRGAPVVPEPTKLGLTLVPLVGAAEPEEVPLLLVREVYGLEEPFTPHLACALQLPGLVHQRGFEKDYQLLCGRAAEDPRIAQLIRRIGFVPVYAWDSLEVVLRPVLMSVYGQYVIRCFTKLQPRFPNYKCSVQWNGVKKRYSVLHDPLTPDEAKLIEAVPWPGPGAILEALEPAAFDSVEALAVVNESVRRLLTATEVD